MLIATPLCNRNFYFHYFFLNVSKNPTKQDEINVTFLSALLPRAFKTVRYLNVD